MMIEQRPGHDDAAPWVVEAGRRLPGRDSDRRISEVRIGLTRHAGVRTVAADIGDEELDRTLMRVHDAAYLDALAGVESSEPVILAGLAAPGMPVDIPVTRGLVAAAREGARAAIGAARATLAGECFTYALCRPPGHHAGPGWLGGYCYLNNAAVAAHTLLQGGIGPVGILDLDLHYPNGTSAILDRMSRTSLCSLHASPVTNVPPGSVLPRSSRERVCAFSRAPREANYLGALSRSIAELADSSAALVVSLGYDTVKGDPHGSWDFSPPIFTAIGRLLAACGLPICVVQEGGYALGTLAACAEAFANGLLGVPDPDDAPSAGSSQASPSVPTGTAPSGSRR